MRRLLITGLFMLLITACDQKKEPTKVAVPEKPDATTEEATPNLPIYRYQGYKEATGELATDGIFQDFSTDSGNLGYIWSDSDATMHDSDDNGWIKGHVVRNESAPFLRIEFNRQGYGGSTTIVPVSSTPEVIPANGGYIKIPLRTSSGACLGVRIKEADNEIWAYGPKLNEYNRLCLKPDLSWQYFELPISRESQDWYKFPYSGNLYFGTNTLEAEVLVQVTFEIGPGDEYYFGIGEGNIDIGSITLSAKPHKNNKK